MHSLSLVIAATLLLYIVGVLQLNIVSISVLLGIFIVVRLNKESKE